MKTGMDEPRGVVFDFDGTLIGKSGGALDEIVDTHALPLKAEIRMAALRKKYVAKILDGSIVPSEERSWFTETLDVYIEHRLNRAAWQGALADVRLRPGAAHCLSELCRRNIRVGIVSYNCADFIEYVLRQNGVAGCVDAVLAARITHGGFDRIVGYDRTTLVYPDNKDVWSYRFAEAYGIPPHRLLAVGDSVLDRKLALPYAPRLGIARDVAEQEVIAGVFPESVVVPDDSDGFSQVLDWILRQFDD